MEINTPPSPSHVVIAIDATKDRNEREFRVTINNIRVRGDILRGGDTLLVLGVLHRVTHPLGYQSKPCPEFFGTSIRAMEEEISKKVDAYVNMLQSSADDCEDQGVTIDVKITAGIPIRNVILQEVLTSKAAWVVLDRHLRRDLKFYVKQIPCKVALVQDSLNVDIMRNQTISATDDVEHKEFYSMSRPVPLSNLHIRENKQRTALNVVQKQQRSALHNKYSGAPLLCAACGIRTELYIQDSVAFTCSEIQQATDDFAKGNLLGEGGYGLVYKGKLKDGQLIAAKVWKQESTQGFAEFSSEVSVLSFARHKNIVMLLGYCCKENLNILVYEYICNKSLYWHLFDNAENVLDWHQRRAIAIGTAKGLRYLHEECRGGPIIHRDMRPSNILLTHDLVPMLGDFGLARWKINDDTLQTKILGTLGYLAPEYAENGFVSVRTDVYAFGIILLQLISGRKVIDLKSKGKHLSLRQWAEPLIEKLALHELIDPRIRDTYDTYQLYLMAKTAYLCVQESPEMRPSMGEVLRLLEGENNQFHHLKEKFVPRYTKR
ncbi:cold-responsive protein kinase 1-like [Durio zibethinus]|uniref:Cold-responsive protein kinase 1-like n=1 Tax=Durio zibethinus TaxID=66656 RepID=A0A6P6AM56_DURZI|nr:cold-responsive protein kinase 1-like [Durio zibethinus]